MEPVAFGDYRAIARLGRGGMADVFLAVRNDIAGFTRLVVIKRLRDDLATLPEGRRYRSLLLDEARIAARLRHPNIVQAFEVRDDTHMPYLALEYLEGQTLANVMTKARRARTPIPRAIALAIASDLLSALTYAHGLVDYDGTPLRVVHRDVSPQNVFVTYEGEVKLVDFGVAKFARAEETEAGVIKGKLGYMAPEQARGSTIDGRADVFSVGVVLWELMAGRRLVRKGSQAETLQRLLFEPMPSLDGIVPDIEPAISAICSQALERDVEARYPDAASMRADIDLVLGGARPRREEVASFIAPMFDAEQKQVAERIRAAITGKSLITLETPQVDETRNEPATTVLSNRRMHETEDQISDAVASSLQALPRRRSRAVPILAVALAATFTAIGIVGYSRVTSAPNAPATVAASVTLPPSPASSPANAPVPDVRLCGSNTVGAALAPALVERYLRTKRGASSVTRHAGGDAETHRLIAQLDQGAFIVEISAHGTGTAFERLAAETCDLGMASRPMSSKEVAGSLGDLRAPATEHVIALDGIAVIVHPNNPLRTIERERLRDVFTGAIADWSQLGGTPRPIHVFARDSHSGTFDTFKAIVLGSTPIAQHAKRIADSNELADAVAADPDAIGFIGLPYIRSAKAVAVSDAGALPMVPTSFTITTEGYLLARRLFLYHRANDMPRHVADLVAYALSAEGQTVVRESGFIDLEVAIGTGSTCGKKCPARYAKAIANARRLSLDFRFRTGRDAMDSRATRDLDRLVHFLAAHQDHEILLLGFSDSAGDPSFNVQLSRQRANAVAEELALRGVRPGNIEGFGAAMPVASNASEADRERNRRVEVWLRPRS
ncbi:MAG: protein kinase domain-containing protein [Kofleriaceae bacterium]